MLTSVTIVFSSMEITFNNATYAVQNLFSYWLVVLQYCVQSSVHYTYVNHKYLLNDSYSTCDKLIRYIYLRSLEKWSQTSSICTTDFNYLISGINMFMYVYSLRYFLVSFRIVNIKMESIQRSLQETLIVTQCLGLLPVHGICGEVKDLKFKWKSWKVLYTLLVLCGISLCNITSIYETMQFGVVLYTLSE